MQVERRRDDCRLAEYRVNLSAMMRLVVEEMSERYRY